MKKFISIIGLALMVPIAVGAEYYISDYDPDYAPYNLQEVVDTLEYESCVEEVKAFDNTYNEYLGLYGTPISVGDTLDVNFGALKEVTEEEFRQCLALLRVEMQEESLKDCDFDVIDELTKDEKRTYQSEIKECEDKRALEDCDFEYIEEMDGSDKFKYRNEIDVCEASLVPEVVEPEPIKQVVEETPVIPVYEPVVYKPTPEPVVEKKPIILEPEVVEEKEIDRPTAEATTTEPETFVMTQDEIDALVEQKMSESEQTPVEIEPEPSEEKGFFARVWSFFTSWF